jgi:hypothetical protein
MGYYAEIDGENRCFRILHKSAIPKITDKFIPIPEPSERYLGAIYSLETRKFIFPDPVEPEPEPPEPPEPPNFEKPSVDLQLSRLEAQNLIIMEALATVYAETLGDKADDQTLADLYTPLVEAGRKTIEQVPERVKSAVQDRVSAKGDGGVKDAN